MLLNYDAMCPVCQDVQEYSATYEDRHNTPMCEYCDKAMEMCWVSQSAYVRPESMYAEGTIVTKGRKTIINDCDDPWETVPGLNSDMSEEFVAKGRELRGQRASNWGDRRGSIVFDAGRRT